LTVPASCRVAQARWAHVADEPSGGLPKRSHQQRVVSGNPIGHFTRDSAGRRSPLPSARCDGTGPVACSALVYRGFRQLFALVVLSFRSERSKELDLLWTVRCDRRWGPTRAVVGRRGRQRLWVPRMSSRLKGAIISIERLDPGWEPIFAAAMSRWQVVGGPRTRSCRQRAIVVLGRDQKRHFAAISYPDAPDCSPPTGALSAVPVTPPLVTTGYRVVLVDRATQDIVTFEVERRRWSGDRSRRFGHAELGLSGLRSALHC
jgi:hypothetical protein